MPVNALHPTSGRLGRRIFELQRCQTQVPCFRSVCLTDVFCLLWISSGKCAHFVFVALQHSRRLPLVEQARTWLLVPSPATSIQMPCFLSSCLISGFTCCGIRLGIRYFPTSSTTSLAGVLRQRWQQRQPQKRQRQERQQQPAFILDQTKV